MSETDSNFRIDKSAFQLASDFDESEEKSYWTTRTPQERLEHMEVLRRINYGTAATARLQRVFEVVEFIPSADKFGKTEDK